MYKKKERLSYLKLAAEVQACALPLIRKGSVPVWKIHLDFVARYPVSLNTFRKMLKVDVSDLDRKIEAYRAQLQMQHLREVAHKRLKRIR